jgi:hypothetical protein
MSKKTRQAEQPTGMTAEPLTPAQRIRADWKALIARVTYRGMLSNIPYVAFIALLCIIYIANSHRAVETQRELNKQQQVMKELRWRHMDIKTRLMNAGMETEMIHRGALMGLKPLMLPAYSIITDSNKAVN